MVETPWDTSGSKGPYYEATRYAVPVFLELLRPPATSGKHDIPRFSRSLVYWAILFGRSSAYGAAPVGGEKAGVPAEIGIGVRVQATKDAVVKGRETYLGILEGDNSGVKIAAAYLLGLIGASDFDTLEEIIKSD